MTLRKYKCKIAIHELFVMLSLAITNDLHNMIEGLFCPTLFL